MSSSFVLSGVTETKTGDSTFRQNRGMNERKNFNFLNYNPLIHSPPSLKIKS